MTRRQVPRSGNKGSGRLALVLAAGLVAGNPAQGAAEPWRLVPGKPVVMVPRWTQTPPKRGLGILEQSGQTVQLTVRVGTLHNPAGKGLGLRLFLNRPDATIDTPLTVPGYLGSFAFFPVTPPPGAEAGAFTVDLRVALDGLPAKALQRLVEAPPQVTAILVPLAEAAQHVQAEADVTEVSLELQPAP